MKARISTKIELYIRNIITQRAQASKCLENKQLPVNTNIYIENALHIKIFRKTLYLNQWLSCLHGVFHFSRHIFIK